MKNLYDLIDEDLSKEIRRVVGQLEKIAKECDDRGIDLTVNGKTMIITKIQMKKIIETI